MGLPARLFFLLLSLPLAVASRPEGQGGRGERAAIPRERTERTSTTQEHRSTTALQVRWPARPHQ